MVQNQNMEKEIELLMNRMPNTSEAKKLRGYTAAKLAFEKYGNCEAGIKFLNQYLQERPNNIPALLLMGDIYAFIKDYSVAYKYYKRIYDINDGQKEVLLKIINILVLIDDLDQTTYTPQKWIELAKEIYPDNNAVAMLEEKLETSNLNTNNNDFEADEASDEFYDTKFNFGSPSKSNVDNQSIILNNLRSPNKTNLITSTTLATASAQLFKDSSQLFPSIKTSKGGLFGKNLLFKAPLEEYSTKFQASVHQSKTPELGALTSRNTDVTDSMLFNKQSLSTSQTPFSKVIPNMLTPSGNIVINLITGPKGIHSTDSPVNTRPFAMNQSTPKNIYNDSEEIAIFDSNLARSTLQSTPAIPNMTPKNSTIYQMKDSIEKQDGQTKELLKCFTKALQSNQEVLSALIEQSQNSTNVCAKLLKRVEDNNQSMGKLCQNLHLLKEDQVALKMDIEAMKVAFSQMSLVFLNQQSFQQRQQQAHFHTMLNGGPAPLYNNNNGLLMQDSSKYLGMPGPALPHPNDYYGNQFMNTNIIKNNAIDESYIPAFAPPNLNTYNIDNNNNNDIHHHHQPTYLPISSQQLLQQHATIPQSFAGHAIKSEMDFTFKDELQSNSFALRQAANTATTLNTQPKSIPVAGKISSFCSTPASSGVLPPTFNFAKMFGWPQVTASKDSQVVATSTVQAFSFGNIVVSVTSATKLITPKVEMSTVDAIAPNFSVKTEPLVRAGNKVSFDLDESDTSSTKEDQESPLSLNESDEKDEYDEERETGDDDICKGNYKLPPILPKGETIICDECCLLNPKDAALCLACSNPLQPSTPTDPSTTKSLAAPFSATDLKTPSSFTFNFASQNTDFAKNYGGIQQSSGGFVFDASAIFNIKPPAISNKNDSFTDSVSFLKSPKSPGDGSIRNDSENHYEPPSPGQPRKEIERAEEGSHVLFAERAKLYRFDTNTKEWKERGTGLLKIIEPESGGPVGKHNNHKLPSEIKKRIILRRDHVFKLACNHYIPTNAKLIPFASESNKDHPITKFSWYALDFASPENIETGTKKTPTKDFDASKNSDSNLVLPANSGKNEFFTVKFKTPEIASEFKKIFEESSSPMVDKLHSAIKQVDRIQVSQTSASTQDIPSNSSNECDIVYDNRPDSQLISKAITLKLSPYFYDYMKNPPDHARDPLCATCNESSDEGSDEPSCTTSEDKVTMSITSQQSPITAPAKVLNEAEDEGNKLIKVTADGELIDRPTGDFILFNERGKIYRFDAETNAWKERGTGQMLVLLNDVEQFVRLLFRREQIFKLGCNHRVDKALKLMPGPGSEKVSKCSWSWRAYDFAPIDEDLNASTTSVTSDDKNDISGREEKFTIRFKTPEIALKFYDIIENVKSSKSLKPLTKDSDKIPDPFLSRPKPPSECYEDDNNRTCKEPCEVAAVSRTSFFGGLTFGTSGRATNSFLPIKTDTFALKSDIFVDSNKANVNNAGGDRTCIGNLDNFKSLFSPSQVPSSITNNIDSLNIKDSNLAPISLANSASSAISSMGTGFGAPGLFSLTGNASNTSTKPSLIFGANPCTPKSSGFSFGPSPFFGKSKLAVATPSTTTTEFGTLANAAPSITLNLGSLSDVAKKNKENAQGGLFGNLQSKPTSLFGTPPTVSSPTASHVSGYLPKPGFLNTPDNPVSSGSAGMFNRVSSPTVVFSSTGFTPSPSFTPIVSSPFSIITTNTPSIFGSYFSATMATSTTPSAIFDASQNLFGQNITNQGFGFGALSSDAVTPSATSFDPLLSMENASEIKPFVFDKTKSGQFPNPSLFKPTPLFGSATIQVPKSAIKATGATKDNSDVEAVDEGTDPSVDQIGLIVNAPIVDLVPVVTGEENERPIFDERAKLFRFDPITKEWKEKGLGQFKIMESYDETTGTAKRRFLMRREKIYKVCCNHWITPNLNFQPFPGDMKGNSISWQAVDYSEPDETNTSNDNESPLEAGKREFFTLRFKNKEIMDNFKKTVEKCQKECA